MTIYKIVEESDIDGKRYYIYKRVMLFFWVKVSWYDISWNTFRSTCYHVQQAEQRIRLIEKANKRWKDYKNSKITNVVKKVTYD